MIPVLVFLLIKLKWYWEVVFLVCEKCQSGMRSGQMGALGVMDVTAQPSINPGQH